MSDPADLTTTLFLELSPVTLMGRETRLEMPCFRNGCSSWRETSDDDRAELIFVDVLKDVNGLWLETSLSDKRSVAMVEEQEEEESERDGKSGHFSWLRASNCVDLKRLYGILTRWVSLHVDYK